MIRLGTAQLAAHPIEGPELIVPLQERAGLL